MIWLGLAVGLWLGIAVGGVCLALPRPRRMPAADDFVRRVTEENERLREGLRRSQAAVLELERELTERTSGPYR